MITVKKIIFPNTLKYIKYNNFYCSLFAINSGCNIDFGKRIEYIEGISSSSAGYSSLFMYPITINSITIPCDFVLRNIVSSSKNLTLGSIGSSIIDTVIITESINDDGSLRSTVINNTYFNGFNVKNIIISKAITEFGYYAFINNDTLENIYYEGTEEEWNNIIIHNNISDNFTNANKIFNYDIKNFYK